MTLFIEARPNGSVYYDYGRVSVLVCENGDIHTWYGSDHVNHERLNRLYWEGYTG